VRRILLAAATAAALIVPGILSAQGASAGTSAKFGTCLNLQGLGSIGCSNWAGYYLTFNNPDPQNDPLGVNARWSVPGVSCTDNGKPITNKIGAWVGLGGVNGQELEQTGVADQCSKGTATYWPFYEFTGCTSKSECLPYGNGGAVDIQKLSGKSTDHIYKGDNMAADVVEQGPGYFVTQLWDYGSTAHPSNTWYYAAIYSHPMDSVVPTTADWVMEDTDVASSAVFPKYSPAELFQNCYWNQDGAQNELGSLPGNLTPPLNAYTNLGTTTLTKTSSLYADNMSFSVAWRAYG